MVVKVTSNYIGESPGIDPINCLVSKDSYGNPKKNKHAKLNDQNLIPYLLFFVAKLPLSYLAVKIGGLNCLLSLPYEHLVTKVERMPEEIFDMTETVTK